MTERGKLREIYRQERLPVFQNRMYGSKMEAKACPTGDVILVEDQLTGLVYNAAFDPQLLNYDQHYQNEQALSPLFRQHLDSVVDIISRTMGMSSLVEVGCGKGFFLELLLQRGFEVIGFDPAYEGDNPRVRREHFQQGKDIRADGLILRHVLEHVQDPYNFLVNLKLAAGGEGEIYIEVPSFEWICERRAWFDVFYEHVNYFTLEDFLRMFGHVVEHGRLFGGQYLYVVAELASLREPILCGDEGLDFPSDFAVKIFEESNGSPLELIVWGGASKGVIFALLAERAGHHIRAIIDINPEKQGKFVPGTGILVESPGEALATIPKGSTICVMNSNYLDEIVKMSNNNFHYLGIDYERL